jgi:hypothetical protein
MEILYQEKYKSDVYDEFCKTCMRLLRDSLLLYLIDFDFDFDKDSSVTKYLDSEKRGKVI